MRRITRVEAHDDWTMTLSFSTGELRTFDLRPLLQAEAFAALSDLAEFRRLHNGGYFVEWASGADLSADTLYLESRPTA